MKIKAVFLLGVILVLISVSLLADERQDLWLKAAAEKDLTLRLRYFEEFMEKYGQREDKSSKFLYFNLATTAFQLKEFTKAIGYAEKALTFDDVDGNSKIQLYLLLANSYYLTQTDIDKAYSYAGLVVEFGQSIKENTPETNRSKQLNETLDKNFIAPALRIQTRILYARGKDDPETMMEAAKKALDAYGFDRSQNSAELVLRFAYNISKMGKIDEAIRLVEQLPDPSMKAYQMLANWYYKKGVKEKAVENFTRYYEGSEKNENAAKTALVIGQLLSKKDKTRAAGYFAEAYLLSNSDKESKAFKYLQQLWYNEIAKGKPREEQDSGFQEMISAARERLGPNVP